MFLTKAKILINCYCIEFGSVRDLVFKMKCPTCGIDRKKEVIEKNWLHNRDSNRKLFLVITCSTVLSSILNYEYQLSDQLSYIFMISAVFYILLPKASYSSASTILGKLSSIALNVCCILFSFVFSYAAIMYMIGLPDLSYSFGFFYFWSGVFVLSYIMSRSLVL